MQFDYFEQLQYTESLDIEDIGNCCIQTFTDFGETCVMIIKTTQGISEIIKYGPVNCDVVELPDFVGYTFQRFQFDQRKIAKLIDQFINSKGVSQALEKSIEEVLPVIRNLVDCMQGLQINDNEDDYDKLI